MQHVLLAGKKIRQQTYNEISLKMQMEIGLEDVIAVQFAPCNFALAGNRFRVACGVRTVPQESNVFSFNYYVYFNTSTSDYCTGHGRVTTSSDQRRKRTTHCFF